MVEYLWIIHIKYSGESQSSHMLGMNVCEWSVFLAQQHVAPGEMHYCYPDFDIESFIIIAMDYVEDR